MVWSEGGHVDTVQHDGNDVVRENFPKLFCNVVTAQRILQGEVELGAILS